MNKLEHTWPVNLERSICVPANIMANDTFGSKKYDQDVEADGEGRPIG